MHIGVCMFNTDYAIRIEELARTAEERRFESLFVPEHTHIPASRRTPFPSGGELPREYAHTLDPFVALAHAAAVTTRIRLGTGICLIIERDTITTAKEVASVDFVSNGRRSEEHTSELQSPCNLVCRLLLEKKKKQNNTT